MLIKLIVDSPAILGQFFNRTSQKHLKDKSSHSNRNYKIEKCKFVLIFFQTPKKKDRGEGLNEFLKTVCGFQMDLCEEK